MSRAQLYNRIQEGSIRPQKDGSRTYITPEELERYVQSCEASTARQYERVSLVDQGAQGYRRRPIGLRKR
jgi:predicted site-specific integrase-resolvase